MAEQVAATSGCRTSYVLVLFTRGQMRLSCFPTNMRLSCSLDSLTLIRLGKWPTNFWEKSRHSSLLSERQCWPRKSLRLRYEHSNKLTTTIRTEIEAAYVTEMSKEPSLLARALLRLSQMRSAHPLVYPQNHNLLDYPYRSAIKSLFTKIIFNSTKSFQLHLAAICT